MSLDSQNSAKIRLLGTPPKLSIKVAIDVALTSIRVRLSRSLVTVSSVILAVAFLLNVLGGNVVNQAVWVTNESQSRSLRQAQALRDVLERPRTTFALLRQMADNTEGIRTWVTAMAGSAPTFDAAIARSAVALADWLAELSPSQAYQIQGNRTREEWLLAFDDEEQVRNLIDNARQLKGIRLVIDQTDLTSLASHMATIRTALTAFADAEIVRLERVTAAGGVDAVLASIAKEGAHAAGDALPPVDQVLTGGFSDQDIVALRRQIELDRARLAALDLVSKANSQDPAAFAGGDVDAPAMAVVLSKESALAERLAETAGLSPADFLALVSDDSRHDRFVDALNLILTDSRLWKRELFAGMKLDPEAEILAKRPRLSERQQSRLNRLLLQAAFPQALPPMPVEGALDLRTLLKVTPEDRRAAALRQAIDQATKGIAADDLAAELDRRERLEILGRTFTGLSYDPQRSAEKTFWLVILSLLVCIVGIVNTMMMAVTERFREIATMKCLGAMDSFILKSFLIESGLVGGVGSALGAVIGLLLVVLQAAIRFGLPFWSSIPVAGLAITTSLALVCGLALAVFGALLPALKAARMHPIEAMRIDA